MGACLCRTEVVNDALQVVGERQRALGRELVRDVLAQYGDQEELVRLARHLRLVHRLRRGRVVARQHLLPDLLLAVVLVGHEHYLQRHSKMILSAK